MASRRLVYRGFARKRAGGSATFARRPRALPRNRVRRRPLAGHARLAHRPQNRRTQTKTRPAESLAARPLPDFLARPDSRPRRRERNRRTGQAKRFWRASRICECHPARLFARSRRHRETSVRFENFRTCAWLVASRMAGRALAKTLGLGTKRAIACME